MVEILAYVVAKELETFGKLWLVSTLAELIHWRCRPTVELKCMTQVPSRFLVRHCIKHNWYSEM